MPDRFLAGSFRCRRARKSATTRRRPSDFFVEFSGASFETKPNAATLDNLLKPENRETLKGILLYHVVPGRVFSDQVVTLTEAPTVAGRMAPIKTDAKGVTIGGARVVKADIETSNGVIHVIDTVMLPE